MRSSLIYLFELLYLVNLLADTILQFICESLFINTLKFFRMTPNHLNSIWSGLELHEFPLCDWICIELINHLFMNFCIFFSFTISNRSQSAGNHSTCWLPSPIKALCSKLLIYFPRWFRGHLRNYLIRRSRRSQWIILIYLFRELTCPASHGSLVCSNWRIGIWNYRFVLLESTNCSLSEYRLCYLLGYCALIGH